MENEAIEFLNSLINDNTTKKELDIIEYIKKVLRQQPKEMKYEKESREVLDYLNSKAGTKFQYVESNLKFISARLKNNSVDKLKSVVDKQVAKWKNTDMRIYLRPETLFNATKFETYANGLEEKRENQNYHSERNYTKQEFDDLISSVDEVEI